MERQVFVADREEKRIKSRASIEVIGFVTHLKKLTTLDKKRLL